LSRVAIALGSNVGDRESHLVFAVSRLGRWLSDLRVSSWYETTPVAVERDRGRQRPHPGAPRTLDLDLILYDGEVIDEPGLRVPHPRFRERLFVLEPLADVAGDWIDPESGQTIDELLAVLKGRHHS
jgi:7,8-dihydro-6-hydroxymethylpterin-pyrophosphokinase